MAGIDHAEHPVVLFRGDDVEIKAVEVVVGAMVELGRRLGKAGDERTAWRKVRQAKAARTRLGREGRRRNISRRRSSPRAVKVVGAGSAGGGSGGCWEAMVHTGTAAATISVGQNGSLFFISFRDALRQK
jgi:hypothetical protein